ncbi:MAG: Uma2 family endonuclease, partial [Dehalococcoidia bacterium]|nr:Uma2 family endonuclease [Dehalococcoidia bacterium]
VVVRPTRSMAGSHYPDLLVAFNADPATYEASNGYIIEEQGKPPGFVLEIASRHTGHIDVGEKRDDYAALGILEYWRFDETGQHHGARLAGDQLVNGVYVPILIEELPDGSLQGYSPVLNLNIRWENGQLAWYDPDTGRHILTYEDQRERADAAEARVRELEAELERFRGG